MSARDARKRNQGREDRAILNMIESWMSRASNESKTTIEHYESELTMLHEGYHPEAGNDADKINAIESRIIIQRVQARTIEEFAELVGGFIATAKERGIEAIHQQMSEIADKNTESADNQAKV
ncbi:hypothetical protein SEA_JUMBO_62 [Gordonia phage Jumbo]|uniref:Uncharacterized protein n=1 Tax=Gordonia phage Jumbo TaxID=1887650 RepID=A0A1B3B0L4_9CAUD|nr:hypothetical protein BIZ69_gp062 [Gordonia phage Jumbo]AOE44570.1 hypothetical protein SEA_JUMBO_62 [Gordonia phage Jumbo]